jgi:mono/diheme cytochrome c family protein
LSRKKRHGDGGSRSHKGKTPNSGPRATAAKCRSCGTPTPPNAKYCHVCGTPLRGESAPKRRDPVAIALYSVIAVSIAAAAAGIVFFASQNQGTPRPPTTADNPAARPGQPVDLTSMSPRQAADQLFNRIMMAQEQGNMPEVMQFAPKALQAYDLVVNLDADAHYHIGLIHAAVGDFDKVRKQVEILRQFSPNHLLGLILEHNAAVETGDENTAAKASDAFAAAYESEIMTAKPEYAAHGNMIEKFRASTAGDPAAAASPTESQDRGATLFASKCASCHGPNATGGDKGPPLLHRTYEPSHHGDDAFYRAVRQGVKSHHWSFGDMPPVAGVTDDEIAQIISYIRAGQAAIGIE